MSSPSAAALRTRRRRGEDGPGEVEGSLPRRQNDVEETRWAGGVGDRRRGRLEDDVTRRSDNNMMNRQRHGRTPEESLRDTSDSWPTSQASHDEPPRSYRDDIVAMLPPDTQAMLRRTMEHVTRCVQSVASTRGDDDHAAAFGQRNRGPSPRSVDFLDVPRRPAAGESHSSSSRPAFVPVRQADRYDPEEEEEEEEDRRRDRQPVIDDLRGNQRAVGPFSDRVGRRRAASEGPPSKDRREEGRGPPPTAGEPSLAAAASHWIHAWGRPAAPRQPPHESRPSGPPVGTSSNRRGPVRVGAAPAGGRAPNWIERAARAADDDDDDEEDFEERPPRSSRSRRDERQRPAPWSEQADEEETDPSGLLGRQRDAGPKLFKRQNGESGGHGEPARPSLGNPAALAALEAELSELRTQFAQLQVSLKSSQEDRAQYEAASKRHAEDNARLHEQLVSERGGRDADRAAFDQQKEQSQAAAKKWKDRAETAEKKLENVERRLKELELHHRDTRAKLATAEQDLAAQVLKQQQQRASVATTPEYRKLHDQLRACQVAAQEQEVVWKSTLQQRLEEEGEKHRQALRAEVEKGAAAVRDVERRAEAEQRSIEERRAAAEEEAAGRLEALDAQWQKKWAEHQQRWKEELQGLQDALKEREGEYDDCQQALAAQDETLSLLRAVEQQQRVTIDAMEAQQVDAKAQWARQEEQWRSSLEAARAQLEQNKSAQEETARQQEQRLAAMEVRVGKLLAERHVMETEKEDAENKRSRLEVEVEKASVAHAEVRRERDALQQRVLALEEEVKELEGVCSRQRADASMYKSDRAKMMVEVERLQSMATGAGKPAAGGARGGAGDPPGYQNAATCTTPTLEPRSPPAAAEMMKHLQHVREITNRNQAVRAALTSAAGGISAPGTAQAAGSGDSSRQEDWGASRDGTAASANASQFSHSKPQLSPRYHAFAAAEPPAQHSRQASGEGPMLPDVFHHVRRASHEDGASASRGRLGEGDEGTPRPSSSSFGDRSDRRNRNDPMAVARADTAPSSAPEAAAPHTAVKEQHHRAPTVASAGKAAHAQNTAAVAALAKGLVQERIRHLSARKAPTAAGR